jgi:hypothetical protein
MLHIISISPTFKISKCNLKLCTFALEHNKRSYGGAAKFDFTMPTPCPLENHRLSKLEIR